MDDGLDETTGTREKRLATESVETAELDVQRSAHVISDWARVWGDFRAIYENNGFGEDIVKIMRQPARKAS